MWPGKEQSRFCGGEICRLSEGKNVIKIIGKKERKERKIASIESRLRERGMRVLSGKKEDKVHTRNFAGGKGA